MPRPLPWLARLAAVAAVFSSGCGEITFFCLSAGAPGLVVEVRAARTGAPIFGALGEVEDGSFVQSLEPSSLGGEGAFLSTRLDRPGTYDVTVRKTGYASWGANGVTIVTGGPGCSSSSVRLTATLERN